MGWKYRTRPHHFDRILNNSTAYATVHFNQHVSGRFIIHDCIASLSANPPFLASDARPVSRHPWYVMASAWSDCETDLAVKLTGARAARQLHYAIPGL